LFNLAAVFLVGKSNRSPGALTNSRCIPAARVDLVINKGTAAVLDS
jgi:hypothetical protein